MLLMMTMMMVIHDDDDDDDDEAHEFQPHTPSPHVVGNVVFTSNESPPSEPIPWHHEMAQTAHPPSHILFYCDVPALEGACVRRVVVEAATLAECVSRDFLRQEERRPLCAATLS